MEKYDLIFGLDIGTRTVIGTLGYMKEKKWHVLHHVCMEHEERAMLDGQVHDIEKVAYIVRKVKEELESQVGQILTKVNIAAAGRTLSTQIATVSKQFEEVHEIDIMDLQNIQMQGVEEAKCMLESTYKVDANHYFCVGHTVISYFVDDYMLLAPEGHKGEVLGAKILATFLPKSVIDSLYAVTERVGLEVSYLTLEPIAAINAVIPENIRLLNLALIDIGAGTSDIAITKDGAVVAYGMIPMAGDEVTETLVHQYLVDFNTAEKMKQQLEGKEEIIYEDIIGLTQTASCEEVKACMEPMIKKLAQQLAKKVLELNGRKATNAVFCIGGGSQMEGIIEHLASELKLPAQRVALRLASQIPDIVYECEMTKGPEMITAIGIAITAARSTKEQFITVMLNKQPITLFHTNKLTVLDVLLYTGIEHTHIFPAKGKSLMFKYNGERIRIKGKTGEAAIIFLNNQPVGLDALVHEGDKLDITYAKAGEDAKAWMSDYIDEAIRWPIQVGEDTLKLPIIMVNGDLVEPSYRIQEGDHIKLIEVEDVEALLHALQMDSDEKVVYVNEIEVPSTYKLHPYDRVNIHSQNTPTTQLHSDGKDAEQIRVKVNGEPVYLPLKESSYMFVNIFDFINFDLSQPKGTIQLILNGEQAAVTDYIKENDELEIYWQK